MIIKYLVFIFILCRKSSFYFAYFSLHWIRALTSSLCYLRLYLSKLVSESRTFSFNGWNFDNYNVVN